MNYALEASFLPEKKQWRVKVSGEIDIFTSPEFKDTLMGLINDESGDVYIDCEELEYIDSTALGTLVALLKRVKETGHGIHLLSVKPNLSKLFKITNLDKAFIIEGDSNDE